MAEKGFSCRYEGEYSRRFLEGSRLNQVMREERGEEKREKRTQGKRGEQKPSAEGQERGKNQEDKRANGRKG